MRAFIYTGGTVIADGITEHPKNDDLRIAADSGLATAKLLGDKVDVFIGDLDSAKESDIPQGVEIIRLKPEKDITDTHAAVECAISKGADEIIIIGGIGSRLDHTLSSLAILEDLYLRGIHNAIMVNGANRVRYVRDTSTLIGVSQYKYISVIAADEKVKGVSIDGCKYPLKNETLRKRFQFAVSNEIVKNCALISVRRGGIFIIESRD